MTAPRVLIADELSPAALAVFRQRGMQADVRTGLAKAALVAIVGDYDGLCVRSTTRVDAEVLAAATRLKVVARAGIGVDNIDVAAATARGVVVMNTPLGNAITTAEHAVALMFALARQIPAADAATQAGEWPKSRFLGVELSGKTLGLVGCGNIGSIVADRAQALRMKVIAFDPFLTADRAVELGVEKVDLETVLARAEVISLHTPLTDRTRNILSAEALARTRPGVFVINCARGGLVDETALRALLDSGHVAGAAFDVFAEEPARANPLFGAPTFIATPHLGAATVEAQENVALQAAEQVADHLLTGAVTNALNMPSITAEEAPRLRPFVALADRLGALAGQMVDADLRAVEIAFLGEVAELNVRPLAAAALAGVLRPALAEVNMVSAPAAAKARGVVVTESRQAHSPVYDSVLRVTVTSPAGRQSFSGTVVAGQPRLVDLLGFETDAPIAPAMLFIRNLDRPGFIGALGTLLGERQVNIATFNLGRDQAGGQAVALVGVDQPLDEPTLAAVRALPHVQAARALRFPAA